MADVKRPTAARLSGVLERATQPDRPDEPEDAAPPPEPEPSAQANGSRRPRAAKPGKPKARTLYLPDELFERIVVQALRRGKTNSEYVAAILDRQVPDHKTVIGGERPTTAAAGE